MELDADTPHTLAVSDTVLVTREWLRKLAEDMSEVQAQLGKSLTIDAAGMTSKAEMYEAFPVYAWAINGNKARRSAL